MDWVKLAGGLASSLLPTAGKSLSTTIHVDKESVTLADPQEIHDGWLAVDESDKPVHQSIQQLENSSNSSQLSGIMLLFNNDTLNIQIEPLAGQFWLKYNNSDTLSVSALAAPIIEIEVPKEHPANITGNDINLSIDLDGLTSSLQYIQIEDEKGDEVTVPWSSFAEENTNHFRLPEDIHSKLQLIYDMDYKLLGGLDIVLTGTLEFEFPASGPWFSWKFDINYPKLSGPDDSDLSCVVLKHIVHCRSNFKRPVNAGDLTPNVFVNGWNSWTYSGTTPKPSFSSLGFTRTAFLPFLNGPNNESYELDKSSKYYSPLFGDWFLAVADPSSTVNWFGLFGYLSQRQTFSVITVTTNDNTTGQTTCWFHCPCDSLLLMEGKRFFTDPATIFLEPNPDPLKKGTFRYFFQEVARRNQARNSSKTPSGWCSWYKYQESITEDQFLSNLDALTSKKDEFPVSVVQLDDGFEKSVGDWSTNDKFPNGMKQLVDKIKVTGKVPGLWLAPYISKPDSPIIQNKEVTVIQSRTNSGYPSKCGVIWNCEPVGLDPSAENTQQFVVDLLGTAVEEWGFKYLKLDFLYAAAVEGFRSDPTLTRAQSMCLALKTIRDAVGDDIFILGCGCPIGTAVGFVDGMRISADTAPNYLPEVLGWTIPGFKDDPHFPSMKNAVRNSIARAEMHKVLWINDPDCLLIRQTGSKLSYDEVIGMASVISMSGGAFFLSDDLTKVADERRMIAESLWPVLDQPATVLDIFSNEMPLSACSLLNSGEDSWMLFTKYNWSDSSVIYKFEDLRFLIPEYKQDPEQILIYHCYEFWTNSYFKIQIYENQVFFLNYVNLISSENSNDVVETSSQAQVVIPAHSARVFSVRKYIDQAITYVGSNLHISGGNEVQSFTVSQEQKTIALVINVGRTCPAKSLWLFIGKERMQTVRVVDTGNHIATRNCGRGILCISLNIFSGDNEITLMW